MNELVVFNAHPATVIIIAGAVMVTPFHALATYVFSGASARKGLIIGAAFLVFGAVMAWVCLGNVPARGGPAGGAIVGVAWILPSAVLIAFRRWFLAEPLSQKWLVGLQIWRVIGGLFLLEMARGHIPGSFAYPAGLGDIAVGVLALWVLLAHRKRPDIARRGVLAVLALGVLDFLGAFFFGNTSMPGPMQLFPSDRPNLLLQYPTGMIPLFLVPYAIFFHTLSWLTLRQQAATPTQRPRTPGHV
ncbi:hypothetical protein [Limnoraphis robusta]|uniref:Uncharacterized protein n=1 Tax=Limnoraphis robusta CCNP1315 TaxID=3110306 RepID=A0ABU5U598_9CYAN|nr:hypothetical protein [Limnoraphis robusta]MEA5522362.1 hypothetical protein [Limnoraphis robusta CCNP1315]